MWWMPGLGFCYYNCYTWGMIVMRDLRSWSPMSAILTPSMKIFPLAASKILKIPRASEDFPAPVLPTIPTWKSFYFDLFFHFFFLYNSFNSHCIDLNLGIQSFFFWENELGLWLTFSLSWIFNVMPFRANSSPLRYCSPYSWNSKVPFRGQSRGRELLSIVQLALKG